MKLSMWIIRDFLKTYHPRAFIKSGNMELRGVRILADVPMQTENNLYLARAEDFIESEKNKVICVHRQDMLVLDTDDIGEVFNSILDCFDVYNMWDDTCMQMIERGASLQEILDASRPFFHDTVYVTDESYLIRGELPYPLQRTENRYEKERKLYEDVEANQSLPLEYIARVRQKKTSALLKNRLILDSVGPGISPCYVMGLYLDDMHIYNLIEINYNTDAEKAKEQIFFKLGETIQTWMEKNRESADEELTMHHLFRTVFSQDKLFSRTNAARFQNYANKLGWAPEQRKKILLIENIRGDSGILIPLCRKMNHLMYVMADCQEKQAVAFLNLDLADAEANNGIDKKIGKMLYDTESFCGMSYAFTDFSELPEQIVFARTALIYGKHTVGAVNRCENYIFAYLRELFQKYAGPEFCHPAVHILRKYDKQHGTKLIQTLDCFLINERDYRKTAERLFVHRNTVQHRVEKIQELTGLNLEHPEIRIHLMASLAMLEEEGWKTIG